MNDQDRTGEQWIEELAYLRQRVAALEGIDSERSRSEQELRRSEARWRSVVDNAPVFVAIIDPADKIQFLNHAAPGMTVEEAIGKSVYDFIQPGYADIARQAIERVRRTGKTAAYETLAAGPNGNLSWYETHVGPVKVADELIGVTLVSTDITERKRAEQALLGSEGRFRAVAEGAPFGVSIDDRDGHILFVNDEFVKLFGYTLQDIPLQAEWYARVYPDVAYREQVFAVWQDDLRRVKTGEITRSPVREYHVTCRDGSVKDVEITFTVAGDMTYVVFHDITDRKQAEAKLRESEEQFRRIFDEGPLGVVLAHTDGRIQHVNRRFCKALGYSEQEIIDLGIRGITHPDDWERQRNLGSRLHHDEIPSYTLEKRYLRKDGQVLWGQLTASMMHDAENRPTHIIGMIEDITARKQFEEAQRESERRLTTLISNLSGAVYRCKADPNWTVEFLSDGYGSLTGYEPSRLIGQPGTHHSELIHPDDRQTEFDVMQKAIAQKRHYQVEYRLRTATGQEKWVWEQGTGVFSESGELEAIEGFTTDITDRKRAEEELQKAHDRLERRVEERTVELREANEVLQAEVERRRQAEETLRESEAKYRALVESSPDAVAMLDLQGRIVFASQRAAEQHAVLHSDDMVGRTAMEFVVESERDRLATNLRRLIEEGVHRNIEYRLLRKDGTMFDAEVSAAVIRDAAGKPEALMGVYRDITERKRAEEQVATLGRFVEAASQGFGMSDVDGRITYMNPMMARLVGERTPEDGLGKNVSTYHSRDFIRKREEVIIPALGRDGYWQGELPLVSRDGTVIPTLHNIFPVRDKSGKVHHFAVVITDITELKQAEAGLRRGQQALRRMVLASDHERRLITYELHDGVAQQLLGAKMLFESQPPPKGRKSKEKESGYDDGMKALLQATSEVRRLMNWLRTPVLDRFGLVEAIEDVASQLRSSPGVPKIEYSHDVNFKRLEPTLENTLFRIAQESMTNACRHSQSEKIRVKLTQKGDEVTLEVRDWGIGFNQDAVAENRFGLEGIRERSRLLGGKLSIKSKPGEGAVIRVTFPVIEATDEE